MSVPYDYIPAPINRTRPEKISYFQSGQGRFPRPIGDAMGNGIHRSGWIECYKALSKANLNIVVDDFVEQTFTLSGCKFYHHEPFIAFFHYPPNTDLPWFGSKNHASSHLVMFSTDAWKESSKHLVAAFCFTKHLGEHLRLYLKIPIHVVKHPTQLNAPLWCPKKFDMRPRIIQVGAFYRDTRAIFKIELELEKLRLLDLRNKWIRGWDDLVAQHVGPQTVANTVHHINRVDNDRYDHFLSTSVIFTHFFAASASNVIVECIARATPLVVNRIAPVIEYLGPNYPLYSDVIGSDTNQFRKRVVDAHLYLAEMKKEWLHVDNFVSSVRSYLGKEDAPR